MKKAILGTLIASVLALGGSFIPLNVAKAQSIDIKQLIQLFIAVGIISPDKIPAINQAFGFSFTAPQTETTSSVSSSNAVQTATISAPVTIASTPSQTATAIAPSPSVPWSLGIAFTGNNSASSSPKIIKFKGGNLAGTITMTYYSKDVPSDTITADSVSSDGTYATFTLPGGLPAGDYQYHIVQNGTEITSCQKFSDGTDCNLFTPGWTPPFFTIGSPIN